MEIVILVNIRSSRPASSVLVIAYNIEVAVVLKVAKRL